MSTQFRHAPVWVPAPALESAAMRTRTRWKDVPYRLVLLAGDLLMLLAAFTLAYWVRFDLRITVAPEIVPSAGYYIAVVAVVVPVWLILFAFYGLYERENLLGGTAEYSRAFHAISVGTMLVIVTTFLAPTFVVSRGWVVTGWLSSTLLVCGARFSLRRVIYALRGRGRWLTRAVVVGTNGEAQSLAGQLTAQPAGGYQLVGVVRSASDASAAPLQLDEATLPVLGGADQIARIIEQFRIEEVIVAASSLERGQLLKLFETMQPLPGVTLRMSSGLYEFLTTGIEVRTIAAVPLIRLTTLRLGRLQAFIKSAMEYALAAAALLLLAPAMAAIAALVKHGSKGPAIYRHRVLGVGGREFDAFKFRTMHANGDEILAGNPDLREELYANGKLKQDPRVTRIGRYLRRYSLDELPQLLNVLRGEMSLVGPRFITPSEASRYGRQKTNLMTVKPGITGLWQVSGRSELSYAERARLDMHYIRNYSIWLDLQILFVQTPWAVIRARGAY